MIDNLLEYVVKKLVERPEMVSIGMTTEGETQFFSIAVDSADRGKVIGREGQTIKALRMLTLALSPAGIRTVVDVASDQK